MRDWKQSQVKPLALFTVYFPVSRRGRLDEYSMSPYGKKLCAHLEEVYTDHGEVGGGARSEQTYPAHTRRNIVA